MEADIKSGRIIPLNVLVTGSGGPSVVHEFNRYYLHWWSAVHFLMRGGDGKFRVPFHSVVRECGSAASFERYIAKFDAVQPQWYEHFRRLRSGEIQYGSLADHAFW